MKAGGKFQSLAATARIANVPSVISNTLVGVTLGGVTLGALWESPPVFSALMSGCVGVLLYLAGNFLNDWADRDWDARQRPERALPRGLFPPGLYLGLSVALMIAALTLAAMIQLRSLAVAGGIVAMIVVYTWIHKRSAWSVIPMGLCRALLPVLGLAATSVNPPGFVLLAPIALFLDIALLSWRARSESNASREPASKAVSRLATLIPALLLLALATRLPYASCAWLGLLPLVIREYFCRPSRRPTPHALISALLASLPMLDWVFLLPAAWHLSLSSSAWTPLAITCLLLPPLAFALGRALQRFATAT